MRIQNLPPTAPQAPMRPAPPSPSPDPAPPVDRLESSPPPANNAKVYGAVGAMTGALAIGRPAVAVGSAVAAGALAGSVAGPIGTVVGAAVGLWAGIKLEGKTKIGRLVGGMVGGAVGSVAGKVADFFGARPSQAMADECKGFSLTKLPGRLLDPHYSSHPRLSDAVAAEGSKHCQPGDVIITNDDGDFKFEIGQKIIGVLERASEALGFVDKGNGVKADWTHIYTVDHNKTCIDILLDGGGPTRFPLEHAFTDNTHAKIMRPAYTSPDTREAYLQWMGAQFGKIGYDTKFDLTTDDKMYCQEYVYKGLQHADPAIQMTPSEFGFGKHKKAFVTADSFDRNPQFTEVWSTGSNFWTNWLSHFD